MNKLKLLIATVLTLTLINVIVLFIVNKTLKKTVEKISIDRRNQIEERFNQYEN